MTYTDEEVDAVALAILNTKRRAFGLAPDHALDGYVFAGDYRDQARAALAARDALFEVVGERWEIEFDDGSRFSQSYTRGKRARAVADTFADPCHVVHVTTKRRKR